MGQAWRKKVLGGIIVLALVAGVGVASFQFGFQAGTEFPKTIVVKDVSGIEPSALSESTTTLDFSSFWETWDIINSRYLKSKEVSGENKVFGAIRGLVGALDDPYSEFFSPPDNKKFQEDIKGNFGGIGAEIGVRNERLLIIAPLEDSPASRVGLRAGDYIVKINDTATNGLSAEKAVQLIRGEEGTAVVLAILRGNWEETKDFRIVRETITIPTLDVEMLGDVAHVELHSFNANLTGLFYRAVQSDDFRSAKGIVLDLRNNPGGYLGVAVDMAGWFLPRGTLVVSEEGIEGKRAEYRAEGDASLVSLPVVLLVNEGSASASEILAGALRDQRKVKLVGVKTYGKGTVQELIDLHDGSSVKLTIAHWVLPGGKVLEGEGLTPDVAVEISEEDLDSERDPQLEKALEILREEMAKR